MRSYYGPDQYLIKSKKPHIQELVWRCTSMSDEEIAALPEKADVKRGLMIIKHLGTEKATVAEKIANCMQETSIPTVPLLEVMNIYMYVGEPIWINTHSVEISVGIGHNSRGDSGVLLEYGQYFAFNTKNQVVFNNVISNQPVIAVTKTAKFIQSGTIEDMKRLDRERISKLK